ncbi:MAG: penicillin-binding protein 2 [Actinomycetota bacterium]|nr:penicillin-binding protein 2 [Actinomycetota bacterium]
MASTGPPRAGSDRFLPPDPRVEGPYRFTPQLALRIGILGAVALLVFGVLFFRLWALQVLSGPQYLQAALDNQLRSVRIEAPRGQILDRENRELVTNVPGTAVQLWPADLPKTWAERIDELKRLSKVLHVPVPLLLREIKRRGNDPITPITVRESVNRTAPISYLLEHIEEFPGVHVTDTFIRSYPYGSLAAHVLGYVNEISAEQLKRLQRKGYAAGDKIGEAGVEASYDAYLRGRAGLAQLRVDSLGKPRSELLLKRQYAQGESIKLTLDIELQRAAEEALTYGINKAQGNGQWAANGGAIVALDPRDGSILALASNPTYEPKLYTGRVSAKRLRNAGLDPSTATAKNFPSLDRAISGVYPAGSTFKPVTALAALQTRVISPSEPLPCTGSFTVYKEDGSGQVAQVFKNWDPFVDTSMTLPTAIAVSCDTFFYNVGYRFYKLPPSAGHPLQAWAAKFGFGRRSGVDLGPENAGLLPTPEWRRRTFTPKTDPGNWQIDSFWKPGDSIQLTIGQKDLLVTPLQMARFYALIANGGNLVRPHIVQTVVEGAGNSRSPARTIHRFTAPAPQAVGLDPTHLAAVQDGLYQATHSSYGTSYGVFRSFPVVIAGKTGTAEKVIPNLPSVQSDQSWWCGYGPAGPSETPEIVVCALIENGGHGGDAAAPAALKVFEKYFHQNAGAVGAVHSD